MSSSNEKTQPMSVNDEETNNTSDTDEVTHQPPPTLNPYLNHVRRHQFMQVVVQQFQEFMSPNIEGMLKLMKQSCANRETQPPVPDIHR